MFGFCSVTSLWLNISFFHIKRDTSQKKEEEAAIFPVTVKAATTFNTGLDARSSQSPVYSTHAAEPASANCAAGMKGGL